MNDNMTLCHSSYYERCYDMVFCHVRICLHCANIKSIVTVIAVVINKVRHCIVALCSGRDYENNIPLSSVGDYDIAPMYNCFVVVTVADIIMKLAIILKQISTGLWPSMCSAVIMTDILTLCSYCDLEIRSNTVFHL